MTKDGGRRIAASGGALLVDESLSAGERDLERLFDPGYWEHRGELLATDAGRGAAWFVGGSGCWVLRHYRRGGAIALLARDGYVWAGEARVRAFAEWRLLGELHRRGLPVPKPIAAGYRRVGLIYRCDLITQRIPHARPLSAVLSLAPLGPDAWRQVGATVARLHAAGADHADLNAHNILLDDTGAVSVIDFDRGRLRSPEGWAHGNWMRRNLARLRRSLGKIARVLPPGRFSPAEWEKLLAGYGRS